MSHFVNAVLNYFASTTDGEKPRYRASDNSRNYTTEKHEVQIENLRDSLEKASLDRTGFQYVKSPTKVTDFDDDEVIEKTYYPESIQLIKDVTGASRVLPFDHTLRRRDPNAPMDLAQRGGKRRQPVPQVHVDQSSPASVNRVRRHLPDEADELLKHRFQIINLWRPLVHGAFDHPLALCDYSSIDPDTDLVPTDLINTTYTGETLNMRYNPAHQWKYVRGLTPDEAVLIKCYDSVQDGSVAILTPHTAFDDPTTPKDAPPRESIEIRSLVFYDD